MGKYEYLTWLVFLLYETSLIIGYTTYVVYLSCCTVAQLFAITGAGWPHNVPWYHQLMPISYHIRDCKSAPDLKSTNVSSAVASTQNLQ